MVYRKALFMTLADTLFAFDPFYRRGSVQLQPMAWYFVLPMPHEGREESL